MRTEIWAHRGASHDFIENTLAAFKQALDVGADGVELDVQRTADGKLVVIHDEHLQRLTGENKYLWQTTYAQLQQMTLTSHVVPPLDFKGTAKEESFHQKVPTLKEVLKLFRGTDLTINVELKNSIYFYPGMERQVLDLVAELGMQEQVLYSSFNHASMKLMSTLVGAKYCGILTSDIQFIPWDYAKSVEVLAYHPMINSLQQPGLVQNCQDAGLKVHVWTADEDGYIYAALLLGVEALMTNLPAKALELRQQFEADGGEQALTVVKALGIPIIE